MNERSFNLFVFGILFGFIIGLVSLEAHANEIRATANTISNFIEVRGSFFEKKNDQYEFLKPEVDYEEMYNAWREYVAFQEEVACLRDNIFYEARNQSVRGQLAVGFVTINRVNNKFYPNSICGVVYDGVRNEHDQLVVNRCQFSWACARSPQRVNWSNPAEVEAFERAHDLAVSILNGDIDNFLKNVTHYHANYVSPEWSDSPRMQRVAQVGAHVFYKDRYIARHTI